MSDAMADQQTKPVGQSASALHPAMTLSAQPDQPGQREPGRLGSRSGRHLCPGFPDGRLLPCREDIRDALEASFHLGHVALVPGLLIKFFGIKQSDRVLEEVAK